MVTDLKSELKQNTPTIANIAKAVEFNSAEIKDCKGQNKKLQDEVKHLEKKLATEKRMKELEIRSSEMEQYKRRCNLRLIGLKEVKEENTRVKVVDITKLAPHWKEKLDFILDSVYRLGPSNTKYSHQIIIQFTARKYGVRQNTIPSAKISTSGFQKTLPKKTGKQEKPYAQKSNGQEKMDVKRCFEVLMLS